MMEYLCSNISLGLPVITSNITIFFMAKTSSDGGMHSNASSTSDNNKDKTLQKRSLKGTSSDAFGQGVLLFKDPRFIVLRMSSAQ